MNYSIEDYEYDLLYYLKYFKDNSPICYDIDVNKIYDKYKQRINNIINIRQFFKLLITIHNKEMPYNKYGHCFPKCIYYDKSKWMFKETDKGQCYENILNQMNIKTIDTKKKHKIPNNELFKTSIIKNDKNENVIMIRIKKMIYITDDNIIDLYYFLHVNKNLKELYIDIRGNGGGNIRCYQILFNILFNRILYFQHKEVKYYFKYTEMNKPFIEFKLKDEIKNIKEVKDKNNQYTHYIIKKFDYIKYPNNRSPFKYKNTINYNGKVYIIIDHNNFSASQSLLDEVKGNDNIIILGDEESAGFGHYEMYNNYDNIGIIKMEFLYNIKN